MTAAALASLIADPMFAKSVAAAATYSGAAITYDMRPPSQTWIVSDARYEPSPPIE